MAPLDGLVGGFANKDRQRVGNWEIFRSAADGPQARTGIAPQCEEKRGLRVRQESFCGAIMPPRWSR
jgi:hypothetical protein